MKKLLLSVSMISLVSGQLYAAVQSSSRDEELASHTVRRLPMHFEKAPNDKGDSFEKGEVNQIKKATLQDILKSEEPTIEDPSLAVSQADQAPDSEEARDENKNGLVFKSKEAALQFVEDLLKEEEYQRKVASGEIILDDDPNYTRKMFLSYASKAGWTAFDLLKPALISGGTRIAVNGLVDLFGPALVDMAGSTGGTLAVKATSFLTDWDSSGTLASVVGWFGKTQARGETLRHMGDLANALEIYGPGAILSAFKAGQFAVNGTMSAYKSAFTTKDDTEVAEANSTPVPGFTQTQDGEETTYSFNNLAALLKFHEDDAQEKEYKRKVESGEIILDDDPNYTRKMITSYTYTAAWTAFDIAKPILLPMGTHMLVNGVISYGGPLLVDLAGDLSKELVIRGGSVITGWDPTGSLASAAGWFASTQARGELLRNMGSIANSLEKYGPPAIVTTFKAGKAAFTGTKAAINTATSSVKSFGKRIGGLFRSSKAPATAAAAA